MKLKVAIEVKFCRFYIKKTVFRDGLYKNSVIFIKKIHQKPKRGNNPEKCNVNILCFLQFFFEKTQNLVLKAGDFRGKIFLLKSRKCVDINTQ